MHITVYSIGADLYCTALYKDYDERARLCKMALEQLRPILCSVPNDAKALCLTAQHHSMLKLFDEAEPYYIRATEVYASS